MPGTGVELRLEHHFNGRPRMSWSPCGRMIAVSKGANVHVFCSKTGMYLTQIEDMEYDVAWSPCGRFIASDRRVFSTATAKTVLHFSPMGNISWSPCSQFISCVVDYGSRSGVHVISVRSRTCIARLNLDGFGTLVLWSPCGRFLACEDWHSVSVWSTQTWIRVATITGGSFLTMPSKLLWSPCGNFICFENSELLQCWSVRTGTLRFAFKRCFNLATWSWSPCGSFLIHGGLSNVDNVALWSTRTMETTHRLTLKPHLKSNLNSSKWSPCGSRIAGFFSWGVYIWEPF